MRYLYLFAITILASSYLPELPPKYFIVPVFVVTAYCLYRRYFLVGCFLLAGSIGILRGHHLIEQQLPDELAGLPITLSGVVIGLPVQDARRQRFLLQITSIVEPLSPVSKQLVGSTLQLSAYSRDAFSDIKSEQNSQESGQAAVEFLPGQHWQLSVKLRRPRGLVNPAGFDYHAHLLRQGVAATGYVVNGVVNNGIANELLGIRCDLAVVDCLRWRVQRSLQILSESSALPPNMAKNIYGVLSALAVGNTQLITSTQWEILKNTGTVHLLAISGLHIGLAASIGWLLGRVLVFLFGWLAPFSMRYRLLPAVCSISLSLAYSLLAGMSLPTQRALVMVLVFHIAKLCFYKISPWTLLALALCMISLVDPLAIHGTGFWLSFVAVAVLLYGFSGRPSSYSSNSAIGYRYFIQALKAQWLLFIGLGLPSLIWLQGMSYSAPLVNFLAIPYVSLFIVPAIFLLLLLLALGSISTFPPVYYDLIGLVYTAIEYLINGLLVSLDYADHIALGFQFIGVLTPSLIGLVVAVVGAVYLLAPNGLPYRYLGLCLLLPVLFPIIDKKQLEITFLDAGQGTAVVVDTKHHRLVYDTGREWSERFNTGEHIIAPYLRATGQRVVDMLMISHSDKDHAGGMQGLLKAADVDLLLTGNPETLPMPSSANEFSDQPHRLAKQCVQGQYWQWDTVDFRVLWPPLSREVGESRKSNNDSCVLLISVGERHVLLTGDIESIVEKELLEHAYLPPNIDILLMPHHGSNTSSERTFIRRVSPTFAIATAGYRNQYRHPSEKVLSRYRQQGSIVFNTASDGAIQFSLENSADDWLLKTWRDHHKRYWY
ncbi:DNA internalization-related competence protein ComEC/Rec2 [Eionea flava]